MRCIAAKTPWPPHECREFRREGHPQEPRQSKYALALEVPAIHQVVRAYAKLTRLGRTLRYHSVSDAMVELPQSIDVALQIKARTRLLISCPNTSAVFVCTLNAAWPHGHATR